MLKGEAGLFVEEETAVVPRLLQGKRRGRCGAAHDVD